MKRYIKSSFSFCDDYISAGVAEDQGRYETVAKGKAYKVFRVKNGKLYPPMVANAGGADTPVGVWLEAEEGEFAGLSKTGRPQVKSTGSGTLSYRPGWHLGDLPRAAQFDRTNKETGEKEFPKDFIWAECEYIMEKNYQPESDEQGYMRKDKEGNDYRSDKYQHSLAGLPYMPKDGYYKYRTNPRPDTVPWIITGAMKVNKLLDDFEVNKILQSHGVAPIHRQGGDLTLNEILHPAPKQRKSKQVAASTDTITAFDSDLLALAEFCCDSVAVQMISNGKVKNVSGNRGNRVEIYTTDWEYETPEVFYSNEDLDEFLRTEFPDDYEGI